MVDSDDGVSVVVACDVTEFGCCPDGVTPALGSQHAGCPSQYRQSMTVNESYPAD